MFTKRYLSGENDFQNVYFRNNYTDNNYVVSTIYKLRPIQLMGSFVYSLYMYILYPAKLEIRRLLYRN